MGAHPGTKFRRMAKRSSHMVRKQHIENVSDYANQIDRAIPKGVLLTNKAGDKVNSMTIGWGTLGTNWNRPVFVAYVRTHRSTVALLDKSPEFTSTPVGDLDRRVVGIAELPLTLECRVVYRQRKELSLYPPEILEE